MGLICICRFIKKGKKIKKKTKRVKIAIYTFLIKIKIKNNQNIILFKTIDFKGLQ